MDDWECHLFFLLYKSQVKVIYRKKAWDWLADFICSTGVTHDVLRSYVWRVFIPLMKTVHAFDCEIQNQVGTVHTSLDFTLFSSLSLHLTEWCYFVCFAYCHKDWGFVLWSCDWDERMESCWGHVGTFSSKIHWPLHRDFSETRVTWCWMENLLNPWWLQCNKLSNWGWKEAFLLWVSYVNLIVSHSCSTIECCSTKCTSICKVRNEVGKRVLWREVYWCFALRSLQCGWAIASAKLRTSVLCDSTLAPHNFQSIFDLQLLEDHSSWGDMCTFQVLMSYCFILLHDFAIWFFCTRISFPVLTFWLFVIQEAFLWKNLEVLQNTVFPWIFREKRCLPCSLSLCVFFCMYREKWSWWQRTWRQRIWCQGWKRILGWNEKRLGTGYTFVPFLNMFMVQ